MSQERIDLNALFDQQEPTPAVPARPNRKPFILILASVLVLVALATGAYLYWRLTDTSDPIRITVYKQPLVDDPYRSNAPNMLPDLESPTIFAISDGYHRFYVEKDYDTYTWSISDSNFFLQIKPNSRAVKEDWSVHAQVENICSATIHINQPQSQISYLKLLDENFQFDGWLVFGYLPHSADLRIQLNSSAGEEVTSQSMHVDPYISPILDNSYGITDQTLQFLDYAVHLQELAPLMDLPEEERLPAYMELAKEQPVLLALLHRMDLLQTIDIYVSSGDNACEAYALKLKSLFDAYLYSDEYWIEYSTFISMEEAAAMDTQSLADYLVPNTYLRDFIVLNIVQIIYLESTDDIFSSLCQFCSPLQELASRDDAASVLLSLAPESLVARQLLTLPEIQRSLKLDDLETYLLAAFPGTNMTLANSEVAELLTNMDDLCYHAIFGTLEETIQNIPLFQTLEYQPDSNSLTNFLGRLRSTRATDTQKTVATAFLSMPAYQQLMNKTQKKLFEESKVQLGS